MNEKNNVVYVEQQWFLAEGNLDEEEKLKTWKIPIFAVTRSGVHDAGLFEAKTGELKIPMGNSSNDFLKFNANQQIPYRVNYTLELWETLIEVIRAAVGESSQTFSAQDRAGLVLHCYSLANARLVPPELLLQLLSSFVEETNYVVWDSFSTAFSGLQRAVSNEEKLKINFDKFVAQIVLTAMKKLDGRRQKMKDILMVFLGVCYSVA